MGVLEDWDGVIQNRLEADAAIAADGVPVYVGMAPQAADSGTDDAFPYILIDDTDFLDYSTARETGFEVFMRIYTFDRELGRKRVRRVQDMIFDALHRQKGSLVVAGHTVLLIDREGSTVDEPTDVEGEFRGVCEYRAIITRDEAL